MHYKTIVMELINDQPELLSTLRESRTLLPSIERWAVLLRSQHLALIDEYLRQTSGVTANEVSSQAMEVAVEQIREQFMRIPESQPNR
ncbi:MAG: hypothetical protein ACK526_13510 [Planctomyces sp.]